MNNQKIIFRADGNSKIGLGHVLRCLALAEIVSKNHPTAFAIQTSDQNLLGIIKETVQEVIVLSNSEPSTQSFQTELDTNLRGDEIIVLDGYHFNTAYEVNLKSRTQAVVSIDDIPSRHFTSDVVFNFCGGLSAKDYSKEFNTRLCLGLEYIFLRTPFLKVPGVSKKYNNRLFLNMGGADPDNNTLKVLKELVSSDYDGEINVAVGANYPYEESLNSILKKSKSIFINRGLTPKEMFNCMSKCALAIVPPSTVALEFLSTGGITYLHQTASNQALQKEYLINSKLALDYKTFNEAGYRNLESFKQYSDIQKDIFDGNSQVRVQKVFTDLVLSCQLSLRKVTMVDRKQCFDWANDPDVRKHSFSTNPILWDDHVKWFDLKMADPNCFYFIAEIDNSYVGQIRFDFLEDEDSFQISYALDQRWRGKGLSFSILIKGIQNLKLLVQPKKIVAYSQKNNVASVKAFQKAGFEMFLSKSHSDSFKFELSFTPI